MTDTTKKPTIEPPEDWKPNSPVGLLRCDSTDSGRLVRFADLIRWLMKTKELPRVSAVALVCNCLTPDSLPWLYLVQPGGFAQLHDPQNPWIKFIPGTGGANQRIVDRYTNEINSLWGDPHKPNTVLNETAYPCSYIAITIEKANSLFEYGSVSDAADKSQGNVAEIMPLHSAPSTIDPPEEWTGERLAAQQAVFRAKGHRDFAKRTWELAGVKERDGRRLVSDYEATKKANAAASKVGVSTVFDMGKAIAKKTKKRA